MPKILVVEDEQMLAKIIGMKLEEEGYEVTHAYDGEEAYKLLTQPELPDLVLLDVLLPKMSGFDVLTKLREEQKTLPKTIVFSNFAQKADVERAHELGAIDYIVKAAFSPAEILSKIKDIFDNASVDPNAPIPAAPADTVTPTADSFVMPTADVAPVAAPDQLETPMAAPTTEPTVAAAADEHSSTPDAAPAPSAYQGFASMEDVKPMSEVLRPGEPNNNL